MGMTNEEARAILKRVEIAKPIKFEDYADMREALDMAIKALEQQPSEDCISREAVEKITWEEPSYDDALNVLTEVRDKVRALPSVTPSKPRGKWIPMQVSSGRDSWKCSICGRRARGKLINLPFCHCGADMRESEDEE